MSDKEQCIYRTLKTAGKQSYKDKDKKTSIKYRKYCWKKFSKKITKKWINNKAIWDALIMKLLTISRYE